MIRVSILFVGSIFLFANLEGGVLMGSWLLFVMIYIFVSEWIERWKKLKGYENRFEHIFVVSNSPEGKEVEIIDEEIDRLVVRVDYEKVIRQAREEEKWLERSGNDFFVGEGLNDKNRLQVVPIIFRDGKYVNESWRDFENRVILEIMDLREKRHEMLRGAGLEYYHKYMNYQK